MKAVVILSFLVVVAFVSAGHGGQYTDRYDKINLDDIITNRRLLIAYVNCLLEKGKCTPEGKELKSHIREALENECGKCTTAQKKGTRKVIEHLINKEPDHWRQLSQKYDPSNKYVFKYEEKLRAASV